MVASADNCAMNIDDRFVVDPANFSAVVSDVVGLLESFDLYEKLFRFNLGFSLCRHLPIPIGSNELNIGHHSASPHRQK